MSFFRSTPQTFINLSFVRNMPCVLELKIILFLVLIRSKSVDSMPTSRKSRLLKDKLLSAGEIHLSTCSCFCRLTMFQKIARCNLFLAFLFFELFENFKQLTQSCNWLMVRRSNSLTVTLPLSRVFVVTFWLLCRFLNVSGHWPKRLN